jgi:hypothetical protein
MMSKVISIRKTRDIKREKTLTVGDYVDFTPCSQDMTICGDCEDNRAKKKCPRLKEWLAKK